MGRPAPGHGYSVLSSEAPHALVLGSLYDYGACCYVPFDAPRPAHYWHATWALVLTPLEANQTRLHVRSRVAFTSDAIQWAAVWMHPFNDFMEGEQLRHLKRCAEGRSSCAHSTLRDVGEGVVGALGMLVDFATPFLRDARSHWGLDAETAARSYPGDDLVPNPTWGWTHGVAIDASPEEVWPWIAQIGQDKGGFYSYQWLENLAGCHIQNADRVHPEWSHPRVGDALKLHPKTPPMRIVAVKPNGLLLAHVTLHSPAAAGPQSPPSAARSPGSSSWSPSASAAAV